MTDILGRISIPKWESETNLLPKVRLMADGNEEEMQDIRLLHDIAEIGLLPNVLIYNHKKKRFITRLTVSRKDYRNYIKFAYLKDKKKELLTEELKKLNIKLDEKSDFAFWLVTTETYVRLPKRLWKYKNKKRRNL